MNTMEYLESILLVDDDPTLLQVMERAFKRRNFEVHVAQNIADAMNIINTKDIEKAVLDLKIAHESGLHLIPMIKEAQPGIQMVMLTGYSSINTAVEAIKLGATHYLCKPADADDILQAFENPEGNPDTSIQAKPPSLNRLEWEHIQKTLAEHEGNISATARALGMHRRTLQRKLQKRPVKQ